MSSLSVDKSGRFLVRDGAPFFWLADTCWSAFTSISDEDWLTYLDRRAEQGFTVVQLNALAQWDRCGCDFDRYPFATADHGRTFDFSAPNDAYFGHARWMCAEAVRRGITPAIVVMWCNYVPDTWASRMVGDNVIPEGLVAPIVERICSAFNEFDPIYIVSGDTDFDSDGPVERYRLVTEVVERCAPEALLAYHIKGRYDGLPEEFADHADIYLYQSGHNLAAQEGAFDLATSFLARPTRRPVVNSEPCYEQMGYSHMLYGRFRREDCRRALWRSILAGACAGITYGAHGVWNWQDPTVSQPAPMSLGEGFLQALPHDRAVALPGAEDFGFARSIVEQLGLVWLDPWQEVLASYEHDVRAARTGSWAVLYVPTNAPIKLHGDFSMTGAQAIDLATGENAMLDISYDATSEVSTVEQGTYLEDALYLVRL